VYKYRGVDTRGIVYEAIAKKLKGYLTLQNRLKPRIKQRSLAWIA
jgi:hypothetical protein